MAITVYTGQTGSGKSYESVKSVLLEAVRKGREVITNIPVNFDLLEDVYPDHRVSVFESSDPSPDWWITLAPGAVIIIDEAWRYWPSGKKTSTFTEKELEFFTMHRHRTDGVFSTEIVLLTQDFSQLAAAVRQLVQVMYYCRNMSVVGAAKRYRLDVYRVDGGKPDKSPMRQLPGEYKEEVYRFYKSQTQGVGEGHATEDRTDERANLLRSPLIRYGMPVSLVVFVFSAWHAFSIFMHPSSLSKRTHINTNVSRATPAHLPQCPPGWLGPCPGHDVHASPVKPAAAKPLAKSVPVLVKPRGPHASLHWRLSGVIQRHDKGLALLSNGSLTRTVSLDLCHLTPAGVDYICKVDGEIVAPWTGAYSGDAPDTPSYHRFTPHNPYAKQNS